MAENLGLIALAQIQALEARPQADAFRARWLGGRVLNASEAIAWLRDELGAREDQDRFSFEKKVGTPDKYGWTGGASAGGGVGWVYLDVAGAGPHDLAVTARGWVDLYGWAQWEALTFALTDTVPTIQAVTIGWSSSARHTNSVSGPLSERITLTCRPQATVADVTRAYQDAQQTLLRMSLLAPRERTKPMTKARRVDLAVMGGRVYREEFETWAAAMAAYNAEHADGTPERADSTAGVDATYRTADSKGRFRKDVRDSFKQATGLNLDFQPAHRRGSAPSVSLELADTPNIWKSESMSGARTTVKRGKGQS